VGRTGRGVRRARRRPDRRLRWRARWQTDRAPANGRRLDLGQIPGDVFEVLGQIATCPGDISQRTASTGGARYPTGRSLTGTPRRASGLRGLGAARGRPGTIGRRAGFPSPRKK
jgi:hypothetical protein